MKQSKILNIFLLGLSGAGKGSQALLLKSKFSLELINTGDLLRAIAENKTVFGQKLSAALKKGHLAPNWLTNYLWLNKLLYIPLNKGVILEGSPRSLEQATLLTEVFNWLGRTNYRAIYLKVSEKEVTKRLLARRICTNCGKIVSLELNPTLKKCPYCGGKLKCRADDTPSAIKNRIAFFHKEVKPVISYFQKQKRLIEINGEGTMEEVHYRILASLKSIK